VSFAKVFSDFRVSEALGVNSVIRLIGKFAEPMAQLTATNL
jgi:hypothetical protein